MKTVARTGEDETAAGTDEMRLGEFWSRVAFLVVMFWSDLGGVGSDHPPPDSTGNNKSAEGAGAWVCSAARMSGLNPTRGMVLIPWVVMAGLMLLVHALRGALEVIAFAYARFTTPSIIMPAARHSSQPMLLSLVRPQHNGMDGRVGMPGAMPWAFRSSPAFVVPSSARRSIRRLRPNDEWDMWALTIHATCVVMLGVMTSQRLAWPCSIHSLLFSSPAWLAPFIVVALLVMGNGTATAANNASASPPILIHDMETTMRGWDSAGPRMVLALMWPEIIERFVVAGVYHLLSLAAPP